jgi:predicted nucleic acid-binding protein
VAAYFFDSSALVKRYAREAGTAWVFSLVRPSAANHLYLARITGVEIVSALTRRERAGLLNGTSVAKALARFEREFINRYTAVEVSPKLVAVAMRLARSHGLRGYDAVQLAAALTANEERLAAGGHALMLISADDALNTAAVAEGLAVDNPNNHP